ncbi:MAG: universal stress protein [Nitrospirae bacterium]|nr:universal stress protein [Nitrospirota bacterium]
MTPVATRILVPTDFSACALHAEDYALLLAKPCAASVDLLYVAEFVPGMDLDYPVNKMYLESLQREGRVALEKAEARLAAERLTVRSHQEIGIPGYWISQKARELKSDLIVMGTHGRTGLQHVLLGSTAERTMRFAPCPVLAVRVSGEVETGKPSGKAEEPPALRKLLVPVDFSDCSLEAVEYVANLAAQFSASVTLLHVLEPVAYGLDFTLVHADDPARTKIRIQGQMAEMAAALQQKKVTSASQVIGGLPIDGILRSAEALSSDLIVMGTHGRRGVSHLLLGSVVEGVVRRAPCPVLAVKSPKYEPTASTR